jgi:hypothetical protein
MALVAVLAASLPGRATATLAVVTSASAAAVTALVWTIFTAVTS